MGLLLPTVFTQKKVTILLMQSKYLLCVSFLWLTYSTLQQRQLALPGTASVHKACASLTIYLILGRADPTYHRCMRSTGLLTESEIKMSYAFTERQQCLQQSEAQD